METRPEIRVTQTWAGNYEVGEFRGENSHPRRAAYYTDAAVAVRVATAIRQHEVCCEFRQDIVEAGICFCGKPEAEHAPVRQEAAR